MAEEVQQALEEEKAFIQDLDNEILFEKSVLFMMKMFVKIAPLNI